MKTVMDVIGFVSEHSGKVISAGGAVVDVVALWRRANASVNADGSVNDTAYDALVADAGAQIAALHRHAAEARMSASEADEKRIAESP